MLNEFVKKEALRRLEKMTKDGMHPDVLKAFKEDGTIYYSEKNPLGAILYWCNEMGSCPQKVLDKIKQLEEKGYCVYHVTHERAFFGECWDLFCIGTEDTIEVGPFNEDNITFAYVMNVSDDMMSEYGDIQFKVDKASGGILRTA